MPPPGTRRFVALIALVGMGIALSAASCGSAEPSGPSAAPATSEALQSTTTAAPQPTTTFPATSTAIPYGPLPAQLLDVYRSPTPSRGTIVYFHSGGWVGGSRVNLMESVRVQTAAGFDVVAVDHRLAPEVRGPEILADADRAVRFVRANADALGIDASPLIVSGSSAGGLISTMLGAAPGRWADPSLPEDLAATSPAVDGVFTVAGPVDLVATGTSAGWGPPTAANFLGCSLAGYLGPDIPSSPCPAGLAESLSPLTYARAAAASGAILPPAYLVFGPLDTLASLDGQGRPLYEAWSMAAGADVTVLDGPPGAGHNLDEVLDRAALAAWLDVVVARSG